MSVTEPSEIDRVGRLRDVEQRHDLDRQPGGDEVHRRVGGDVAACSWPAASAALMSASVVKLTISTSSRPACLEQALLGGDVPLAVAEPGLDAHLDRPGLRRRRYPRRERPSRRSGGDHRRETRLQHPAAVRSPKHAHSPCRSSRSRCRPVESDRATAVNGRLAAPASRCRQSRSTRTPPPGDRARARKLRPLRRPHRRARRRLRPPAARPPDGPQHRRAPDAALGAKSAPGPGRPPLPSFFPSTYRAVPGGSRGAGEGPPRAASRSAGEGSARETPSGPKAEPRMRRTAPKRRLDASAGPSRPAARAGSEADRVATRAHTRPPGGACEVRRTEPSAPDRSFPAPIPPEILAQPSRTRTAEVCGDPSPRCPSSNPVNLHGKAREPVHAMCMECA